MKERECDEAAAGHDRAGKEAREAEKKKQKARETLTSGEQALLSDREALEHLEAAFLSGQAVHLAVNAIADLQVQGRLVGIISHVPELKERIPVRLDVIPGQRGSRAGFYGMGN